MTLGRLEQTYSSLISLVNQDLHPQRFPEFVSELKLNINCVCVLICLTYGLHTFLPALPPLHH